MVSQGKESEAMQKCEDYILMHKDIPVIKIRLDSASGVISSVGEIYQERHLPVGVFAHQGIADRKGLNEWWRGRAIPASRDGVKDFMQKLHIADTQILTEKSMGLSLSDQYWVRQAESKVTWAEVNFFENTFAGDVGDLLFGKGLECEQISLMSPDNTSDGWLKKKWMILEGKRCLLKGGSGAVCQEPYNEVIASRIMKRLGISHVPYTIVEEDSYPYSLCEDFITPQTELVSAWYIMQTRKKQNHVSVYRHYLDCCEALGICGMKEAVDQMLVLDYLIVNEDRHQNNFGVIRNAETLEYIGAAPIYDSGSSLWFNKPTVMINGDAKVNSKPFRNTHEEQIKLVSSFSWVDFGKLTGIEGEMREIFRDSLFVDDRRTDALCRGMKRRIEMLEKEAKCHKTEIFVDNTDFDVRENVSYSGEGRQN